MNLRLRRWWWPRIRWGATSLGRPATVPGAPPQVPSCFTGSFHMQGRVHETNATLYSASSNSEQQQTLQKTYTGMRVLAVGLLRCLRVVIMIPET